MAVWNQQHYIQAWHFASHAHQGQCVPSTDSPYIHHLAMVAMEVMTVIATEQSLEQPDLLVQVALLHDVLEDTATTYEQLAQNFGVNVADGVLALTKNTALAKAEQMPDSLTRIRQQAKEICMVKMADRITNLQSPPTHWNQSKIQAYHTEAKLIYQQLHSAHLGLAKRLQQKIQDYQQYIK